MPQSQTISGDTEREAALVVQAHARRLDDLTRPRNAGGGHGLDDADHVVHIERERFERATAEHERIKTLRAQRAAKWNAIAQLKLRVANWVLRELPGGVALEVVEDEPISKLLKKGETISEAVQRIRTEIATLTEKITDGRALAVALSRGAGPSRAIDRPRRGRPKS